MRKKELFEVTNSNSKLNSPHVYNRFQMVPLGTNTVNSNSIFRFSKYKQRERNFDHACALGATIAIALPLMA